LLKFISDIINIVSASFQIASVSSILLFLSNLGITISVWVLSKTNKPDLILFAFILSFIPFLISVIASIYLFKTYFKSIKPSLKYVNFKESKSVISLGTQFFILQIVYLLIFQTDNILIVQFFNPREVTNFNVAYKYYSIVIVFFTVVLTPYWTAFTEAFFKEDFVWIKSSISKLIKIWVVIFIISILMILISAKFFKIWVGEEIKIPLNLSISLCFYVAIVNWSAIFSNFLNGIGKIRLQILIAPFVGCLNLLISFLFVKYFQFGLSAIPFANALSLSFGALLGYAQYKKIVNKQASGIWNK
jgi:O-antigen/teichoic acid export membrane protein